MRLEPGRGSLGLGLGLGLGLALGLGLGLGRGLNQKLSARVHLGVSTSCHHPAGMYRASPARTSACQQGSATRLACGLPRRAA